MHIPGSIWERGCLRRQSHDEETGIVFGDSHVMRRLALSSETVT